LTSPAPRDFWTGPAHCAPRACRQTAASVVKHLTLGVTGLGCEDALEHLMNFVWPNVFEQSPHVSPSPALPHLLQIIIPWR